MIVLSVTVYCLNTLPQLKSNSSWKKARSAVDILCMCWFTLEFAIRLMVCPDRFSFVQSVMNWIDFLSVIPSYLVLFFIKDLWLNNLVIIRLLRLFRFFKLSYGLQVLLHTLKASFYELTLLALILLIPIVIFSSLVHTVEMHLQGGSEKFVSIPATFWWCLITMTSVGYGDMVPATWAGKLVGSVCAICGVLIVALPISVIGSNFSLYYAHVRARLKLPCKDRKILAGNLRGLLKQPLSLSSRERDRRGLKWTSTPALRRKGASRKNCSTPQGIQLDNSFSSLEEKEDRRSSSDACLDWDNTMDSQIKFDKKEASKKRTSQGSRRKAVGMLFPASDSEKSAEEVQTVPFPRARRGGQAALSIVEDRETCSEASDTEFPKTQRNSDFEERNSDKSWKGDENAFEDQINKNDSQSLDLENISRQSSMRGSDSQATSSRRNSMRLMNLSVIPPNAIDNDIVLEFHGRKRRETVTSNDEPTVNYQKKKRTKVKKPKKSSTTSYTKMKNSMPVPTRKRRGCVLTLNDEHDRLDNERIENGYLSDSSDQFSCSPSEPRGSCYSSAGTAVGKCKPLIDVENMNHNSIEPPADISLKLISHLKQIDNEKTPCNHRSEVDHGKTVDLPARTDTRLDSSGQVIPNSFARQMILRDDLNNKMLVDNKSYATHQDLADRKQSRSEFDLRTKIDPTYVVLKTDRHPFMREISSDLDLRLLESGV